MAEIVNNGLTKRMQYSLMIVALVCMHDLESDREELLGEIDELLRLYSGEVVDGQAAMS